MNGSTTDQDDGPVTITGVIVRRSCMGKRLSFCDIQRDDDDTTANNSQQRRGEEEDAENNGIIKVSFRRDSGVWRDDVPNKESSKEAALFPIKNSDLPYGARVEMTLYNRPKDNGLPTYEVSQWKILTHPKQAAEELASHSGGGGNSSKGISYSTYLRERGNQFAQMFQTRTSNSGAGNNDDPQPPQKKRPRPSDSKNNNNNNTKNDDLAGHGDKQAKAMRARLFAKWIMATFGKESLQQGTGVLDVAGGKGQLSVELAATGQIPCTVIDPLIRKTQQHTFPIKRDAKRIRKAHGPLPRHLPTYFNQTEFLQQYGQPPLDNEGNTDQHKSKEEGINNTHTNDNNNANMDDSHLVTNASCLIGLHPDQSTQDILDIAIQYNKNMAIVPCCVFPSFFPLRTLKDGSPVVAHADFIKFLQEKDTSLQQDILPFEGRNVVLYRYRKKENDANENDKA